MFTLKSFLFLLGRFLGLVFLVRLGAIDLDVEGILNHQPRDLAYPPDKVNEYSENTSKLDKPKTECEYSFEGGSEMDEAVQWRISWGGCGVLKHAGRNAWGHHATKKTRRGAALSGFPKPRCHLVPRTWAD